MMSYWVRQFFLLVACICVPFACALWFDTQSLTENAISTSVDQVNSASIRLQKEIELWSLKKVTEVASVAHLQSTSLLFKEPNSRRPEKPAIEELVKVRDSLRKIVPQSGFAWLVDVSGEVVVRADQENFEEDRFSVAGHPLFLQARSGFMGDGLWKAGSKPIWALSTPVDINGRTRGVIIVAWRLDESYMDLLSSRVEADVSLATKSEVILSTLSLEDADEVVESIHASGEHFSGSLDDVSASLFSFPLVVGPLTEHRAMVSWSVELPGGPYYWIVSKTTAPDLADIAQRQLVLIVAGLISALVLLGVAMWTRQVYIQPIKVLSAHLSGIQMGKADIELPEPMVSKPFRRLVRLTNMLVQKIPSRGLQAMTSAAKLPAVAALGERIPPPPSSSNVRTGLRIDSSIERFQRSALGGPISTVSSVASSSNMAKVENEQLSAPAPRSRPTSGLATGLSPRSGSAPFLKPPSSANATADLVNRSNPSLGRRQSMLEDPQPLAPPAFASNRLGPDEVIDANVTGDVTPSTRGQLGVRAGGSLHASSTGGYAALSDLDEDREAIKEATLVAPVAEDLLARSLRDDFADSILDVQSLAGSSDLQESTVVASVRPELLAQTLYSQEHVAAMPNLDEQDERHFREVYDSFIDMRRNCGEDTSELSFERFTAKLKKNRRKLMEKYNCRTVRFQVYEKDNRAAVKATPVRS